MVLINTRQSSHKLLFNSLNIFFNEYLYSKGIERQDYYFQFTEDNIKVYTSRPIVVILELVIFKNITIYNYHLPSVVINELTSFLISELCLTKV